MAPPYLYCILRLGARGHYSLVPTLSVCNINGSNAPPALGSQAAYDPLKKTTNAHNSPDWSAIRTVFDYHCSGSVSPLIDLLLIESTRKYLYLKCACARTRTSPFTLES